MHSRTTLISCLAVLFWLSPFCARAADTPDAVRLGHVRIAGVNVQGLAPAQARKKLDAVLRGKLNSKVRLTDGTRSITKSRKEIGIEPDVEGMVGQAKLGKRVVRLQFRVDATSLAHLLRSAAAHFDHPGRNARPIYQHGRVRIAGGADGRVVNIPKSVRLISDQIELDPGAATFRLAVARKPPAVDASALKGINARLSQFVTTFNPASAKRSHNIRAAVKRIDGTVLKPGQVFSLNETVKERTHENGYLTATVFENHQKAEGIGGGVSQVTGTLFNAALLADLKIVQYMPHSRPVAYLPVGRDATVVWGTGDLKIKNDTQAPICIDYKVAGNRCVATIFGAKKPGMHVILAVQKRRPGATHIVTDLYRIVTRNGRQVDKEKIGHADYDWKPEKSHD